MRSIFDRWTDLDPALALRRIEAAHGSAIFDRYSYLDSERAIKQIEDALALSLDDVMGVLNFRFLEAAIDAAVAGGGAPNWVPANAKIHIDLVNNRAWTAAAGIVAIDTLLGSDPNTENGWGTTSYDPANLTAEGYYINDSAGATIAFIGTAHSSVLGSFTMAIRFREGATNYFGGGVVLLSADGNDALELDYVYNANPNVQIQSWEGSLNVGINDITNHGTASATNIIALTVSGSRCEVACNGSDPATGVIGNSERPSGNPLVAALLYSADEIQSVTIYDALSNTSGLSELSRVIPENAKIHINLVQQWAWTEADGFVAIDTLLGSDPNTVNAWSASNYDPAQLTAYGYVAPDLTVLALIGGARERVLSGSTLVLRNIIPTSDLSVGLSFVLASATGDNTIEIDLSNNNTRDVFAYSGRGSANLTYAPIVNAGANGAINTLAATVTPTRLELSVNGSTALSTALTTDDFPVSGDVLVAALISQPNAANALQSITIYDALPDTTGLSALSATGVMNTAPTAIHALIVGGGSGWGGVDPAITVTATELALVPSYPAGITSVVFNVVDAEGNPCEITVTADTSGKVSVGPLGAANALNLSADITSDSPISFTLRATDPGGLHVDQTFTITVTA